jgi:threonine synthase
MSGAVAPHAGEARAVEPLGRDLPISYACAGCGYASPSDRPVPLRCPQAAPDDDIDHVMGRVLETTRLTFPAGTEANPFVRFRTLLHSYHLAVAHGWSDARYVEVVERLDAAIVAIDGRGFRVTPFQRQAALSERLGFAHDGGVLVKDETNNVSGSHKARHLMGTLLELEVADALKSPQGEPRRLAIASCGNAALAAAVVAAAAGRDLDVFIPVDANPAVVTRLQELGAHLTVCERQTGVAGDPTVEQLRAAIEGGAVAFTCQGNENGLAVEGGLTLAWEMATELAAADTSLDRLFVQVGGGALASACVQGLDEARRLGANDANPAFHPVQAATVAPLARAFDRLAHRLDDDAPSALNLAWAAQHRSAFMWPWEGTPHSVATGILDDETYDWLAVVRGTLASGGSPVVVDEATLLEANEIARETTRIDVDPTGTAGLAGLLDLRRRALVNPTETVAVIFTGVRRDVAPDASTPPPAQGDQR